jgi:PiT family inorganic phosphate transporter
METVQTAFWVVALLVVLALMFDFMNGFHGGLHRCLEARASGVVCCLF